VVVGLGSGLEVGPPVVTGAPKRVAMRRSNQACCSAVNRGELSVVVAGMLVVVGGSIKMMLRC